MNRADKKSIFFRQGRVKLMFDYLQIDEPDENRRYEHKRKDQCYYDANVEHLRFAKVIF